MPLASGRCERNGAYLVKGLEWPLLAVQSAETFLMHTIWCLTINTFCPLGTSNNQASVAAADSKGNVKICHTQENMWAATVYGLKDVVISFTYL